MKILIAEDDDVSRLLLASFLRAPSGDHTVVEAANAAEAWSLLNTTHDLDLCIFDVMLPDQSGLDLLARVRESGPHAQLPVILCTALNDRLTVTRAAALGVTQYLVKPFARETVLEKVKRAASQPVATEAYLENAKTVCERLHVDAATYRTLLGRIVTAMDALVHDGRHLTHWADVRPLVFRANALKGAALNLGASGLATQLDLLESALGDQLAVAEMSRTASGLIAANAFTELNAAVERIAAEKPRLEAALAAKG